MEWVKSSFGVPGDGKLSRLDSEPEGDSEEKPFDRNPESRSMRLRSRAGSSVMIPSTPWSISATNVTRQETPREEAGSFLLFENRRGTSAGSGT